MYFLKLAYPMANPFQIAVGFGIGQKLPVSVIFRLLAVLPRGQMACPDSRINQGCTPT